MDQTVLAIDIGTTSVKAIIVSSERRVVARASLEHNLLSARANWAEEDADVWWEHTERAISMLAAENPQAIKRVAAVGVSGMVPAIVLLDEQGRLIRNTIQQNDARAIKEIERLRQEIDQAELFEKTGSKTNQQHILPRLLWIRENEPEVWARIACIMGSYDYIAYRLTGVKTLESNWAAESGCYDIRERRWLSQQLESYDVRPEWLPKVREPMQIIGPVHFELCGKLGLPEAPVIAGSADHVASTLAAGVIKDGDLLIKFGGAGDILYCADSIRTDERLYFDYHVVPGKYLINGCMAASGSLVKWFVKEMLGALEEPDIYRKLDNEAMAVPPASDGLIILPYFLGEKTPLFDPIARGVLFGLTLSHQRGHIFRAILESVVYGFRHHIDVLADMGLTPGRVFATNGGAKSGFWCQIAADVLGQPVTSFPDHPGSSLGVAFLAGMAVGVFSNWEQIYDFLADAREYAPNPANVGIYDKAYGVYRALYRQLRPSFEAVQGFYR